MSRLMICDKNAYVLLLPKTRNQHSGACAMWQKYSTNLGYNCVKYKSFIQQLIDEYMNMKHQFNAPLFSNDVTAKLEAWT